MMTILAICQATLQPISGGPPFNVSTSSAQFSKVTKQTKRSWPPPAVQGDICSVNAQPNSFHSFSIETTKQNHRTLSSFCIIFFHKNEFCKRWQTYAVDCCSTLPVARRRSRRSLVTAKVRKSDSIICAEEIFPRETLFYAIIWSAEKCL